MNKIFAMLVGLGVLMAVIVAHAHSYQQGAIKIGHIWARATPAGVTTAAVYVPLLNTGMDDDHLVGASSPAAKKIQIHSMSMDGDIMKMRSVESVDLPPGKPVALRPNGTHFMLIGLNQPLKQGDKVPVTLQFEKAGAITVDVMIEGAGAMSGQHSDD
jgi:copper(I)-binding protein